jgi:hypothetical protein
MFQPKSKEEILKHRYFIGFQDAFVGPPRSSRKFINLDAVAIDDFNRLDGGSSYKDLHTFVVEYRGRSEVFDPEVAWYRFELAPVTARSNARIIRLLPDGYDEPLEVHLSRAEKLPAPQSVSAKATIHRHPSGRFNLEEIRAPWFGEISGHERLRLLKSVNQQIEQIETTVVVHDIGQASCVSIVQRPPDGKFRSYLEATWNNQEYAFEKVMLDCGFPLYFNWERDGLRKYDIGARPIEDALIILSHWDMDHYELGRRNLDRRNFWLAPTQVVGPTSWRIASHLAEQSRIAFVKPNFGLHLDRISIWRGPASPKLNDSGIFVALATTGTDGNGRTASRRFLYPADCALSCMTLPQAPKIGSHEEIHVAVSHHGSEPWDNRLPGHPGKAVISSGWRNRYKHPIAESVQTYADARFLVQDTRLVRKDIPIAL